MFENFGEIWKNHGLLIIVCCAAPIILLAAFFLLGFGPGQNFAFFAVLVFCIMMHFVLMKDMHKGHGPHLKQNGGSKNE